MALKMKVSVSSFKVALRNLLLEMIVTVRHEHNQKFTRLTLDIHLNFAS